MEYKTLYDNFAALFPSDALKLSEAAKSAQAEAADGMHIMFGMVVMPFLPDLLADGQQQKLRTAFAYFEQMAGADDPRICEVL